MGLAPFAVLTQQGAPHNWVNGRVANPAGGPTTTNSDAPSVDETVQGAQANINSAMGNRKAKGETVQGAWASNSAAPSS